MHFSLFDESQNPGLHASAPQAGGTYNFSQRLGSESHLRQTEGAATAEHGEQVVLFSLRPVKLEQDRHWLEAVPEHVRQEEWHFMQVAG